MDKNLRLDRPTGRAAYDLVDRLVADVAEPPTSSIVAFKCQTPSHVPIRGALECYGAACPICTAEGSSSRELMYLLCGK
jgi:hypothetical protein